MRVATTIEGEKSLPSEMPIGEELESATATTVSEGEVIAEIVAGCLSRALSILNSRLTNSRENATLVSERRCQELLKCIFKSHLLSARSGEQISKVLRLSSGRRTKMRFEVEW